MTSKVAVTYTIKTDDEDAIIASHESGDDTLYVWIQKSGDVSKEIALSLDIDAAEQLSDTLKQLAVKMRCEQEKGAKPMSTPEDWDDFWDEDEDDDDEDDWTDDDDED